MTRSMTGFGRAEVTTKEYKLTVELKSVNHRYCDISVKLPKKLNFFEASIRSQVKKYAKRGKIDVFITYEDFTENKAQLKYNKDIATSYYKQIFNISSDFMLENTLDACTLARFPDVFTLEEQEMNEEQIQSRLTEAIDQAATKFVETRSSEGKHLEADLLGKLDEVLFLVDEVEKRSPEILTEHENKIKNKVSELLGDKKIDDTILATEMVAFADKICVDEETVRLRSHILNTKNVLEKESDSVGRKLDFIAQEMNREANTILSKANDIEIANHAINLKTEIEKIREQIQNIE